MNKSISLRIVVIVVLLATVFTSAVVYAQTTPQPINTSPQPVPAPTQEFSTSPVTRSCNRQETVSLSKDGYVFDVIGRSMCQRQGGDDNLNRKQAVEFRFGCALVPNLFLRAFKRNADVTAAFSTRFLVDRIVEFTDANGIAGFQPGADTVVQTHDLIGRPWSKIARTVSSSDSPVVKLISTLTPNDPNFIASQLRFGALTTEQEVVFSNSTVKVVLTPNSIKSIFEMDNIRYQASGNASRLAIGVLMIVRGDVIKRNDTVVPRPEGDRPYEPTGNQTVTRLTDPSQAPDAGFFSWQKFIIQRLGNNTVRQSLLLDAPISAESSSGTSYQLDNSVEAGFKIMRVWLSLQDRVDNLSWDPSVGSAEEEVSTQDTNGSTGNVQTSAAGLKKETNMYLMVVVVILAIISLF